jgi:hypothetical protein
VVTVTIRTNVTATITTDMIIHRNIRMGVMRVVVVESESLLYDHMRIGVQAQCQCHVCV